MTITTTKPLTLTHTASSLKLYCTTYPKNAYRVFHYPTPNNKGATQYFLLSALLLGFAYATAHLYNSYSTLGSASTPILLQLFYPGAELPVPTCLALAGLFSPSFAARRSSIHTVAMLPGQNQLYTAANSYQTKPLTLDTTWRPLRTRTKTIKTQLTRGKFVSSSPAHFSQLGAAPLNRRPNYVPRPNSLSSTPNCVPRPKRILVHYGNYQNKKKYVPVYYFPQTAEEAARWGEPYYYFKSEQLTKPPFCYKPVPTLSQRWRRMARTFRRALFATFLVGPIYAHFFITDSPWGVVSLYNGAKYLILNADTLALNFLRGIASVCAFVVSRLCEPYDVPFDRMQLLILLTTTMITLCFAGTLIYLCVQIFLWVRKRNRKRNGD